jgi:hypothetical protein
MKLLADLLLPHVDLPGEGIKGACRKFRLPYEELRKVVRSGHVPSDKTLLLYAERLGLDPALLILTAYWQKAPTCAKPYMERALLALEGVR